MKLLKCCGIREDLESYEGIDMLGFNFITSSKRYITPEKAAEIQTPFSILRVGVFGKPEENGGWGIISKGELVNIIMMAGEAKMNAIQIHGVCDFEYLKLYNFLVIQSVDIYSPSLQGRGLGGGFIDFYIIDGKNPGSGESYDYSEINSLGLKQKFLIAGGVSEENVGEVFEMFKENEYFCGVDVASGVESWKNIDDQKVQNISKIIKDYV